MSFKSFSATSRHCPLPSFPSVPPGASVNNSWTIRSVFFQTFFQSNANPSRADSLISSRLGRPRDISTWFLLAVAINEQRFTDQKLRSIDLKNAFSSPMLVKKHVMAANFISFKQLFYKILFSQKQIIDPFKFPSSAPSAPSAPAQWCHDLPTLCPDATLHAQWSLLPRWSRMVTGYVRWSKLLSFASRISQELPQELLWQRILQNMDTTVFLFNLSIDHF